MPKLAANISMMFTELDFVDRFRAAANCGFAGVECQFPYAWSKSILNEQLVVNGLSQVLINVPPGNVDAGDRGLAAVPGREVEFRDSLEVA